MDSNKNIRVEYLCKQPFWKFTKTGSKEYCKVCKHHIQDFTNLNIHESINLLEKEKGKTCGIFYEDQFIVDKQTKHGPNLLKLFLAGTLTILTTIKANAQTTPSDSKKIELFDTDKPSNSNDSVKTDTNNKSLDNCSTDNLNNNSQSKKTKYFLRIGRTRFYLSWKFPFLHARKITRGFIVGSRDLF